MLPVWSCLLAPGLPRIHTQHLVGLNSGQRHAVSVLRWLHDEELLRSLWLLVGVWDAQGEAAVVPVLRSLLDEPWQVELRLLFVLVLI